MRSSRRLPLETLAPFLFELPAEPATLNWSAVFGNDHSVQIEIGFGKGLFLLTEARNKPDVNYLGVEILRKLQLFVAARMAKRCLANVRLAKADARRLLSDYVAENSVAAVHLYFPDPWWKRRHWKRRVFSREFAMQCERVLQPNGALHLATDVAEYFTIMQSVLAEQPRMRPRPPPNVNDPANDLDYLTNFERKFRKEGRAIYRAIYEVEK